MALKKSCLFFTFGEATCPRFLFLRNSYVHANTIGEIQFIAWVIGLYQSINKELYYLPRVGLILPFIGHSMAKYLMRVSCKKHNFIISLFSDLRA